MLDAALEARALLQHKTLPEMSADRVLSLALVKLIEIIGEAASAPSAETRAAIPDIPWPLVRSMRNRLIHAYFEIDYEIVWSTVTEDLSPLIEALERSLSDTSA
ncbi:MAG TPA: HepT-like ribonuclease domain-containing protein [Chloroflexota bacterium]|nr:HepT-like ribonuclease domain-containing protein [Chloroflexota bacterium]